jgi:hypothetical protein
MARKRKRTKKSNKAVLTEAKTEDKTLLNEATIRRFQKLANMNVLSELDKTGEEYVQTDPTVFTKGKKTTGGSESGLKKTGEEYTEKKGTETTAQPVKEQLGEEEMEEELPPPMEGEGEEDLGELEDLEGLEGEVDEGTVEDLVSAIADAITDTTGIPVNVEGEGGGEEELEDLEGLEGEEELPPPDMGMGEEEGLEGLEEGQRAKQLKNYLISEVSNRIKARVYYAQQQQQVMQEQAYRERAYYAQQQQRALYEQQRRQSVAGHEDRKQQLAESLADRIFTKLKGKKQKK